VRRIQPELSPAPVQPSRPERPVPLLLLEELRPKQWTKNLVVLAPLLFARSVFQGDSALKALVACASFCLLASAIYLLNDWVDRDKDRLHPEKKNRPIASGAMSGPTALIGLVLCLLAGGGLALWVGPAFAMVGLAYVSLQILYSALLKRLVILDVVVIAMGFVLRVLGGGVAIGVPVSNWLYLCTLLLAIFLGFAKRRHELALLYEEASSHRANLSEYSLPMLDQMISVVAASCILAYALYTVAPRTLEHVGSDRLKYTVPFVIYGIFRYLFLIHKRGAGGSPERVLLSDPATWVDIVLFLTVASWALYW
jgi:4-hydroxybenzoate polyprenyltransferase